MQIECNECMYVLFIIKVINLFHLNTQLNQSIKGAELSFLYPSTFDQAVFQDWAKLWSQKHAQRDGAFSLPIKYSGIWVAVMHLFVRFQLPLKPDEEEEKAREEEITGRKRSVFIYFFPPTL